MSDPIILTRYGETLLIYPDTPEDDSRKMENCLGIHAICRGWMDLREVSDTHKAIVCRGCNLRIYVPNDIETFGQLRSMQNSLYR